MKRPLARYKTDFLEYSEIEKGLSPITVKNYSRFLQRFFDWLDLQKLSGISPDELTEKHIWRYRMWLSRLPNKVRKADGNLHISTQTRYLIALRALLAYFHEKDIPSLPTEKIKLPKDHKTRQVKFLSLEQIKKLLDAIDTAAVSGLRDRAIIESFFSTGMRVAELVSLDRKQLETFKKGEDHEISIKGKGSYIRTVYFSPRAMIWIKKYLGTRQDEDPALFIRYKGPALEDLRLTTRAMEGIVGKYARLAGLPVLATPHTLRHSFATDLLNEGVDLRTVQEFLGHKNIATTQVYTHITNKRLKDIHKKFHGGRRLNE
ncbi:MAG: tyrosine-type recombinase/integrase [Candidatus Ryanbacteria bacterium]|nr:tyrosine-type recombinase/integrase [Candidatus Ryanbacteria bacterium]